MSNITEKRPDGADELLMYLEHCMVLSGGCINIREFSQANLQTMWLWKQEGLLDYKQIPYDEDKLPSGGSARTGGIFTHRLRLSRELYERAWQLRITRAEKHSPTLNPSKQQAWTSFQNNSNKSSAADESRQNTPEEPQDNPEPNFKGFQNFLAAHNNTLTPPQEMLARELFDVFGQKKYEFFMHARSSGKTWLLKAIDQYMTSLQTPLKKSTPQSHTTPSKKSKNTNSGGKKKKTPVKPLNKKTPGK